MTAGSRICPHCARSSGATFVAQNTLGDICFIPFILLLVSFAENVPPNNSVHWTLRPLAWSRTAKKAVEKMKNIFGLFLTVLGAYIWQVGYNMLTPSLKDKYIEKLMAKFALQDWRK